jgi:N-acetylglucosaminyl-diphospho-decaprenol L-rhamnosyltransferase
MMELSVILVNFNDCLRLEKCLASLKRNPPAAEYEIIVVDNGSEDGSCEALVRRDPNTRLIPLAENIGFARANNRGFRESRGRFLLFLNTDTVIPAGAVDGLLGRLKSDSRIGAVGPALLRGASSYQVSFGQKVDFFAQYSQKFFLNPYFKLVLKRSRRTREVGWLSAACLLCRRGAFERAGMFDEHYFLYFEDIDLCASMRAAGYKLVFLPEVRVFHEGGATTVPRERAARLEYRKSQLYFYRKHNSGLSLRLLLLYLGLGIRILEARGAFRGEEGKEIRGRYRQLLKDDRRAR